MRGLVVRSMQIADLKSVNDFRSNPDVSGISGTPWDTDCVADILAENLDLCHVAVFRKRIMGFIIGAILKDSTATVEWILLTQQENIATICDGLVDAFIISAQSRGARAVRVSVPERDSRFSGIFEKFGFTITGRTISLERTFSREVPVLPGNRRDNHEEQGFKTDPREE